MALFKQYGAIGILAVMMVGVLNFLGSQIFSNAQAIATVKERQLSEREVLKDIRDDVKWLRNNSVIKK